MKDVIIIGAGPAGLVAGAHLLNQGHKVTVLERQRFPRVIVGESLLPLSMEHFKEVGFFPALNSAGFTVKPGARFIKNRKYVDFSFSEQFTDAWTWTWQVPRADFDQLMASEFEKKGGTILFGAEVTRVETEGHVEIEYDHEGSAKKLTGDFVVDASGFGCVMAKATGQTVHRSVEGNWAMFVHVDDVNKTDYALPERICFHVMEQDLWMWVIPFSNGTTSLGFAGSKNYFEGQEDSDEEIFRRMVSKSEEFGERFEGVEYKFDPKWYRGYSQHSDVLHGENWVACGNTVEFLDPVFSSGVALATYSGLHAAKIVAKQLEGSSVDWDEEYDQHIRKGVNVFRTYIETWYDGRLQDIFFSDNLNNGFKRQICSVLAGYVWDETNPFVRKHKRGVQALHRVSTM